MKKIIKDFELKVIVVLHSLTWQGGVSSVVSTFAQVGLFDDKITLHESCGGHGQLGKLFYSAFQFIKFPFKLVLRCPQLVHIHCSSGVSFYRKCPYVFASKLFGRKVILGVHPSHFLQFYQDSHWTIHKLIHITLSLCDALGFVNTALCEEFTRIFPNKAIYHLRNPVNLTAFYPPNEPFQRQKQALFLGAIMENKGVFDIIKAIPLILEKLPEMKFVFCGDHRIKDLQQKVDEADLINSVDIRYWVGYKEKIELLQNSTMLLLPSYSEGFPIVILEAMACGLPVICSDVGGIREAVTDSVTGLFIRPGDIEGLVDKVVQLASDKTLQSRLRTKGLKVVKHYSAVRLCRELKEMYAQVIERKNPNIH